jgi:hypothetical protein
VAIARLLVPGRADQLSPWWSSARFQGELLPDWQDDWLIVDRERLRQLRLHALERLAEGWTAQGNLGEAIRQFKRCREMLLVQFGVEPTSATAGLLRSHRSPAA